MADQTRTDIKTAGGGTFTGGTYGDVTFNGSGTMNGDVDAITFRVNGAGTSNGRVKAQSVTVNGTAGFNGEVQASEFVVNGDASIRDGAGIGRLVVKGNLSVGGGVAAHEVELQGFLRIGGDCEAESFTGEGGFTVAGLLNAGNIDVAVHGPSSAREIGGERIVVRQPTAALGSLTGLLTIWAEKRLDRRVRSRATSSGSRTRPPRSSEARTSRWAWAASSTSWSTLRATLPLGAPRSKRRGR